MNGDGIGTHINGSVDAVFKRIERIAVESCYKIHINIFKANLARKIIGGDCLLRSMAPADIGTHRIIKCLGIDADSADIVGKKGVEFLCTHAVLTNQMHFQPQ